MARNSTPGPEPAYNIRVVSFTSVYASSSRRALNLYASRGSATPKVCSTTRSILALAYLYAYSPSVDACYENSATDSDSKVSRELSKFDRTAFARIRRVECVPRDIDKYRYDVGTTRFVIRRTDSPRVTQLGRKRIGRGRNRNLKFWEAWNLVLRGPRNFH